MLNPSYDFDVLIIGAGAAGTMCARACARAGLSVAILEKCSPESFGHRFVVEVDRTIFASCNLPLPKGAEIPYESERVFVYAGYETLAFELPRNDMLAIRLDRTMPRLVELAKEEGAKLLWEHEALSPIMRDGVVCGLSVRSEQHAESRISARIVVDASGHAAFLARQLPSELGVKLEEDLENTVIAENRLYAIDPIEARVLADEGRFISEAMQIRIATRGPYSTEMSIVSPRGGFAYCLIGLKSAACPPAPGSLIDRWETRMGCCRSTLLAGGGPIRIKRPSLKLVGDGFALIGEAASTVIPICGSGVGSAMLTGHQLGTHLGYLLSSSNRATTANLWPWAARFQRDRGRALAYYDVLRRIIDQLGDPQRSKQLLTSGLIGPQDMVAGTYPRIKRPSSRDMLLKLGAAITNPVLTMKLLGELPRLKKVINHWQKYPAFWEPRRFEQWRTVAAHLLP